MEDYIDYPHAYRVVALSALSFLAVLTLFAIPSPTIDSPRITPVIGPGNTKIAKNLVAIIAFTARIVPPISNIEEIRTDFWRHESMNAAAPRISPSTGKISPGPTAGTPPNVFIRKMKKRTLDIMASP
jgi:hypothetical protein